VLQNDPSQARGAGLFDVLCCKTNRHMPAFLKRSVELSTAKWL
jgi:hypothetical protein